MRVISEQSLRSGCPEREHFRHDQATLIKSQDLLQSLNFRHPHPTSRYFADSDYTSITTLAP